MNQELSIREMCKEYRLATGISQYKMADLVGTNQTEISFIERGFVPKNKEKIQTINQLFESLNKENQK